MIEARELTRVFDGLTAVDHISLSIRDGEAFAFLGPNGAGKTTTVRMLCCLITPTSGSASIGGLNIGEPTERVRIRQSIGLLPENPGLYESLDAFKNIEFFAKLYDVPASEREKRINDLLKTLDLYDRRREAVGKYSKGMKQKVAIARALVHDPAYLFLDEPTAALDPESAKTVREFLIDLKKKGTTLFLNTHNLDEAQRVADRIGVIRSKLLAVGAPDELSSRFFGRTTRITLKEIRPEFLTEVRKLSSVLDAKQEDNSLLVSLVDPGSSNPAIVSLLSSMNARIVGVEQVRHGLEDIYLKLMEGQ
ncbi:MAG TPA: ABC transporter ATP-binding protein [Methanomassiliicoccales archaeon]|nr:ABC transporter ATP-binding protein [Methanomassiliicoccales archaeon]